MGLGVEIKSVFWPSQAYGMAIRFPDGSCHISSRPASVMIKMSFGLDINV